MYNRHHRGLAQPSLRFDKENKSVFFFCERLSCPTSGARPSLVVVYRSGEEYGVGFFVVVFAILKNGAEFGMMSFDYGDVRPCVLYYVALEPHHHHRQPLKFNDKCLP